MASSGVPPQVRHQVFGGGGHLKVVHPQSVRLPAMHMVHLGGGAGEGAKNEGAGKGIRAGFGEGAQPRAERGESGDAVVTGNYERMPYTTLYGFPIAGGGLTDKGKEDKQAHDQFTQFVSQYGDGRQQGLSKEQALTQAARGLPGGVKGLYSVLAAHPDAMRMLDSADALHARLSGEAQAQYTQVKGADGKYYNVQIDPNTGKAGNPEDIGLPGSQPKGKEEVRLDAQGNRIHGTTANGVFTPGTNAAGQPDVDQVSGKPKEEVRIDAQGNRVHGTTTNGVFTPGVTASGQPDVDQKPLTAAEQKAQTQANLPKTPYSGDPMPQANPQHPIPPATQNYLTNTGNFIKDLKVARDYADQSGPISGFVNYVGGKYVGTNAQGQMYAAALNRIDQGVYAQYGIKGSTGAKQLMATMPTHSEAPSYVRMQLTAQIDEARNEAQNVADTAEQRSGPLPGTLRNQLARDADVYTLSNQGNASPTWVARNYPDKLTPRQSTHLLGRSDLEPSETQGLNSRLDAVDAQRTQDAKTATQNQPKTPSVAQPQNQPSPAPGDVKQNPGDVNGQDTGSQEPQGKGQPSQQSSDNGAGGDATQNGASNGTPGVGSVGAGNSVAPDQNNPGNAQNTAPQSAPGGLVGGMPGPGNQAPLQPPPQQPPQAPASATTPAATPAPVAPPPPQPVAAPAPQSSAKPQSDEETNPYAAAAGF